MMIKKFFLTFHLTVVILAFSSMDYLALAGPTAAISKQTLTEEINQIAQSDIDNDIPRRTEFIVKLYGSNSQVLTPPEIRQAYDDVYNKGLKENRRQYFIKIGSIFIVLVALITITLKKFRPLKSPPRLKRVCVHIPFGIGTSEWEVEPLEQKLAWSLYVELVTRIALQPLTPDEGYLREALNSLYNLFTISRQILKEADPSVGKSPKSMGKIAITVLNQGLRPFLTKWHPLLGDWEMKRTDDKSIKQHEQDWPLNSDFRQELNDLTKKLAQYAESLAIIAGVSRDTTQ